MASVVEYINGIVNSASENEMFHQAYMVSASINVRKRTLRDRYNLDELKYVRMGLGKVRSSIVKDSDGNLTKTSFNERIIQLYVIKDIPRSTLIANCSCSYDHLTNIGGNNLGGIWYLPGATDEQLLVEDHRPVFQDPLQLMELAQIVTCPFTCEFWDEDRRYFEHDNQNHCEANTYWQIQRDPKLNKYYTVHLYSSRPISRGEVLYVRCTPFRLNLYHYPQYIAPDKHNSQLASTTAKRRSCELKVFGADWSPQFQAIMEGITERRRQPGCVVARGNSDCSVYPAPGDSRGASQSVGGEPTIMSAIHVDSMFQSCFDTVKHSGKHKFKYAGKLVYSDDEESYLESVLIYEVYPLLISWGFGELLPPIPIKYKSLDIHPLHVLHLQYMKHIIISHAHLPKLAQQCVRYNIPWDYHRILWPFRFDIPFNYFDVLTIMSEHHTRVDMDNLITEDEVAEWDGFTYTDVNIYNAVSVAEFRPNLVSTSTMSLICNLDYVYLNS